MHCSIIKTQINLYCSIEESDVPVSCSNFLEQSLLFHFTMIIFSWDCIPGTCTCTSILWDYSVLPDWFIICLLLEFLSWSIHLSLGWSLGWGREGGEKWTNLLKLDIERFCFLKLRFYNTYSSYPRSRVNLDRNYETKSMSDLWPSLILALILIYADTCTFWGGSHCSSCSISDHTQALQESLVVIDGMTYAGGAMSIWSIMSSGLQG